MSEEIDPHILRKFEIIQKIGKGAYGVVWKAINKKLKQFVAVKKVFDAFFNPSDSQRTFREIIILTELNGHENILKLQYIIKAENNKDLYLVFDFIETDLHVVIRSDILEEIHKKYVIYQILKALKYMHSGELIHCDLKPSNILLNSQCHVNLADFWLARSVAEEEEIFFTPFQSCCGGVRWYRAPELLLGSTKYSKASDMWNVGCILGEFITGKSIFPGVNSINQIERILELTGKPKNEDIESIESQLAWNILNSIKITQQKKFEQFFQGANPDAIDLLKKLLVFNPKQRISAEQALQHSYVNEFHQPTEEYSCSKPIDIPHYNHHAQINKKYCDEFNKLYYDIIRKKLYEQRKNRKLNKLLDENQQHVNSDNQNNLQLIPQSEIQDEQQHIQQQQSQSQKISNQSKKNRQIQSENRNNQLMSQENIKQQLISQANQIQQQQQQIKLNNSKLNQFKEIISQKVLNASQTNSSLQQNTSSKNQSIQNLQKNHQQLQKGQKIKVNQQKINQNQSIITSSQQSQLNQQNISRRFNQSYFENQCIGTNNIGPNNALCQIKNSNQAPTKENFDTNQVSNKKGRLTNKGLGDQKTDSIKQQQNKNGVSQKKQYKNNNCINETLKQIQSHGSIVRSTFNFLEQFHLQSTNKIQLTQTQQLYNKSIQLQTKSMQQ